MLQLILVVVSIIASAIIPFYAEAESSEVSPESHLELRGSYTQICGVCAFKNERPDTTHKVGVQMYGDYLPMGWETRLGTLRIGPYGSLSWIGEVEKIAAGLAMTFRPEGASWEIFTQTGARYTTDEMRYQLQGQAKSQGQAAFNLAFGARFYVGNQWYLSVVGEHDSTGKNIGIHIFPNGDNLGVDSLMVGFGKMFSF